MDTRQRPEYLQAGLRQLGGVFKLMALKVYPTHTAERLFKGFLTAAAIYTPFVQLLKIK